MRSVLVATVLVAAAVAPATAVRLLEGVPLFVRLEGRVGPPQDATRGAADWQLAVGDRTVRFQLTHLAVMSGNASPGTVVNALFPYKPQARLHGPKDMLDALTGATPADGVTILGYLTGVPGTTQLMVSQLTVTPPVPAATPRGATSSSGRPPIREHRRSRT